MATPSSARRRPAPGDLLPYSFLWSHEAGAGREDAAKERPCVVVLAVGDGDNPTVLVAPITSRDPGRAEAVALSLGVIGLSRASWIIPWELNLFRWPGPDIGRAATPAGAPWRLGSLTPPLRTLLADRVEALLKARRARVVRRSE
jgi:hypothetical protein